MAEAIRQMMNAGNQRAEVRSMQRPARGQRQRAEGPAVKRAVKSDGMLAFGVMARELEGGLDRLGAGVGKEYFFGRGARRQSVELLRQIGHRLVIIVAAANMQKFSRLFLDGFHDPRVRMAGATDGDASHEIQKQVAIDIFDHHAAPLFDD